jgi:MSHA biogenesis protein MshL
MTPKNLLGALLAFAAASAALAAPSTTGRFDLSVNNAPAAQVFMQIGSGTPYNVLVSPEVAGNISITLKDTTVLEAMESLRDLYGYDYRVSGNRILVQPNTVQTRLFKINYLPGRREGESELHVSSSSINQAGTGTSGSGTSGATSTSTTGSASGAGGQRSDDSAHVRTTSDADFWREVRASLVSLVGVADQRSVVINQAAGVVIVRATPNELRHVTEYLKAMQLSIERQVMLEAKIVSVELSEGSQAGVNWAAFGNIGNNKISFGSAAPGATLAPKGSPISDGVNTITAGDGLAATAANAATAIGKGFYGVAFQASNFAAMLNFLDSQGNVRVLSSPRIATLNNQKAVLKVGSDELFITGVSTTVTAGGTGTSTVTPSLTFQPFFSGVALDVTPQIDDGGNVMLHVHPSVSSVTDKVKNINLGTLGSFQLPLALSAVSETDSIVRLRNGQIVAIGGLMSEETRDDRNGLPVLSEVPVFGALFRQKNGSRTKRELVILIRPTVVGEEGTWPDADVSMATPQR